MARMRKDATRASVSSAATDDSAAAIGREITALRHRLTKLEAAAEAAGPADKKTLTRQADAATERLHFLALGLSYQTPSSLDGALAQCVRLITEIGELAAWVPPSDLGNAQPIADCATRLTYAILFALEQATGRQREEFGWEYHGAASDDDPFATLRELRS